MHYNHSFIGLNSFSKIILKTHITVGFIRRFRKYHSLIGFSHIEH
jgi:hypothetical protein